MGLLKLLFLAVLSVAVQCKVSQKIAGPGNVEATPGEFPYLAIILDATTGTMICSGVLIKPKVVLTLGYNFYKDDYQPIELEVLVGVHNRSNAEDGATVIQVTDIVYHPELIETWESGATGDVALLQLSYAVTETDKVKVLTSRQLNASPGIDNRLPRSECTCAGYGLITDNYFVSILPTTLQKFTPQMASSEECKNFTRENDYPAYSRKSWLCSLNEDKTEIRRGDGGSPLVCIVGRKAELVLAGLGAGGTVGFEREGFSFYTRISTYKRWILKNAKKLE